MNILLVSPDSVDAEIVQRILEGHQVTIYQDLVVARSEYVPNTYDLVIIGPGSYIWCMWAEELMKLRQGVVLLINLGGWNNVPVISFLTNTNLEPQLFLQFARPLVSSC